MTEVAERAPDVTGRGRAPPEPRGPGEAIDTPCLALIRNDGRLALAAAGN